MDSKSWQRLFDSFRPEDQNQLVVTVLGGLDVAVQNVARIEEEIVLLRGRIAGEADSGRLFLVPYERITSVYVNRAVVLEEVELFSPSVSRERKQKVAAQVAELAAKEKAKDGEQASRADVNAPMNLKEQLERLREQAGFPNGGRQELKPTPAPAASAPAASAPAASAPAPAATTPIHAPTPAPLPPRTSAPHLQPQFNSAQTLAGTPTLPPRLSSPKSGQNA